MTVEIPPELAGFVQSVISAGSFDNEAEVIGEALRLLQKREQLRQDVQAGVDQLDRGEGIDGKEVFERLQQKAETLGSQDAAKGP